MKNIKDFIRTVGFCVVGTGGLISIGCSISQTVPLTDTVSESSTASSTSDGTIGVLSLTANGEALVEDGFVSKDGWAIAFDHVYLTVADVVATQTPDLAEGAEGADRNAIALALTNAPTTVDLAKDSSLVVVKTQSVPSGYYNALEWSMVASQDTDAHPGLQLIGTATKDNQEIAFDLALAPSYRYTCGPFIGDERKGFVTENGGEIEMTVHIDHIFGDNTLSAEDEVNQDSLGFASFAAIAQASPTPQTLKLNREGLKANLSAEDYGTLSSALHDMGHVGEGHCDTEEFKS